MACSTVWGAWGPVVVVSDSGVSGLSVSLMVEGEGKGVGDGVGSTMALFMSLASEGVKYGPLM